MKNLLLLLLLILGTSAARAQDLLTKTTGEEVQVKVLEINTYEVKYKRTDNPDGPLMVVRRADVFMIRYANGTKEVLNPGGGLPTARPTSPPPAGPTSPPPAARPAPSAASAEAPAVTVVPGDEVLPYENIHLDGPRLGFTVLTGGVLAKARERLPDLNPFLTQFGWQFETRLFRLPNGVSVVGEIVPLLGGLEQGKFLPSVSGLLGIRGPKGFEFGLGPNLTPLGANIVLAVGTSFRSNGINFPVNLAVVPGNGGARVSFVFGFNLRKDSPAVSSPYYR